MVNRQLTERLNYCPLAGIKLSVGNAVGHETSLPVDMKFHFHCRKGFSMQRATEGDLLDVRGNLESLLGMKPYSHCN